MSEYAVGMGKAAHVLKAGIALITVWALLFSMVGAPLWLASIALVLIIAAISWSSVSRWRARELRRQRRARGVCTRCAYDLRGLASARCPECGARVAR